MVDRPGRQLDPPQEARHRPGLDGQWADITQQWMEVLAGAYVRFKNRATGLYIEGMDRTASGSDGWRLQARRAEWLDAAPADRSFDLGPCSGPDCPDCHSVR